MQIHVDYLFVSNNIGVDISVSGQVNCVLDFALTTGQCLLAT